MPKVRAGADKWLRRASSASPDYTAGVQNPRRQWAEATRAAAPAYAQGITQALANGSYEKGATAQAQSNWQQRASTLGAQRYSQGVQVSKDRYEQGFAPYRQAIEATTLPPRGARGSAENYQRSALMGQALHDTRNQRRGQG